MNKNLLHSGLFLITIFLIACNGKSTQLPQAFMGRWESHIQLEGTTGEVESAVTISDDTIIVSNTFPRMQGIDKVTAKHSMDEIVKISDDAYDIISASERSTLRISLIMKEGGRLFIGVCEIPDEKSADAEFSSCVELGEYEKATGD